MVDLNIYLILNRRMFSQYTVHRKYSIGRNKKIFMHVKKSITLLTKIPLDDPFSKHVATHNYFDDGIMA